MSDVFIMETLRPKIEEENIKTSHLREGIAPMIACLEDESSLSGEPNEKSPEVEEIIKEGAKLEEGSVFGFETANKMFGSGRRFFSHIDGRSKYSEGYRNCTGLVCIGRSRISGENISMITHCADHMEKEEEVQAAELYRKHLREFIDATEEKTREVMIVAGQVIPELDGNLGRNAYEYNIIFLGEIVQQTLNFVPTVITGPKDNRGDTNVYLDTAHRRIYIRRKEQADKARNESYISTDLEEQKKKWS